MSNDQSHFWDQQNGEPDAAYVRFLAYRNLGPARTLQLAAATLESDLPVAKRRKTERKAKRSNYCSGQWYQDAAAWHWVARAESWDIWRLRQIGDLVQATMSELVRSLACGALDAATRGVKPKDWRDALTVLQSLATYVPQQILAAGPTVEAPPPAKSDGPRLHVGDG